MHQFGGLTCAPGNCPASHPASLALWQSRHAFGLSAIPKRAVISASGTSSIWCDRALNRTASIMRGMWQETQRLAFDASGCPGGGALLSLESLWHCTHISSLSAGNFNETGFEGAFAGCGSWQELHVACPLRKHA